MISLAEIEKARQEDAAARKVANDWLGVWTALTETNADELPLATDRAFVQYLRALHVEANPPKPLHAMQDYQVSRLLLIYEEQKERMAVNDSHHHSSGN